jgi:streptogramin lyase
VYLTALASVALLSVIFPLFGGRAHGPSIAKGTKAPTAFSTAQRPNVVENGSDVVVRPFATPLYFQSKGFTFTPDGTIYFPYGFGGAIDRFDQAGNFTTISVPRASNQGPIIYAHGSLWTLAGSSGIVKFDVDGSRQHWFPLTFPGYIAQSSDIAARSDGTYVATTLLSAMGVNTGAGAIERINAQSVIQTTLIPYAVPTISSGSDGNIYFSYAGSSNATGIGRIAPSGAITYFPVINGPQKPVYSNGYVYFFQYYIVNGTGGNPTETYVDFSKMNATTGVVTHIGLPVNVGDAASPGQISIDQGGNLWLSVETSSYYGTYLLYGYDVYNGRFTGPIEPSIISDLYYGDVAVGPDDNVYSFAFYENSTPAIDVYVRKVQTLEPAGLSVTTASPGTFSIRETNYAGPWTAVSLSPGVATVSPATSTTGTFSVTEVAHGTTQIKVEDRLGNVSDETITAD